MTRLLLILTFLGFSSTLKSQVGIGTSSPNSESSLDITDNNKGVLIPRIGLSATNNASPLTAHVAGMIVYNFANSGSGLTQVKTGFYYNDGSQWILLEPLTTAIGDLKHSYATQDHSGWYLLDGRTISSLPAKAKITANSIGLTTSLPNASDAFLKGKSAAESLSNFGGNNNPTVVQSNLPNINFNGTANTSGNHTHDYDDKYHGTPENLNIVTGLLGILGGTILNILNNDVGSNNVTTGTFSSSTNGDHNHTATVNTGGISAPLDKISHLTANTFIYLGE